MRKRSVLTLLSICLLLSALSAHATIQISWQMDNLLDEYIYLDGGTVLFPSNSIIQLIWSPTNVPDLNVTPWNWTNPAGSEVILDTRYNDDPLVYGGDGWWLFSGTYDATNYSLPEDYFVSGYVYQRAFDLRIGQVASNDTFFGVSEATVIPGGPLNDADPGPATPDDSYLNDSGLFTTSLQVVPEPGTMSLLGLGIALAALKRKLRRRD